jgi:hypothetical protein
MVRMSVPGAALVCNEKLQAAGGLMLNVAEMAETATNGSEPGEILDRPATSDREIPSNLMRVLERHHEETRRVRVHTVRRGVRHRIIRHELLRDPAHDERTPEQLALAVLELMDLHAAENGPAEHYEVEVTLPDGPSKWARVAFTGYTDSGLLELDDRPLDEARQANSTLEVALSMLERTSKLAERSLKAMVDTSEGYARMGKVMGDVLESIGTRYASMLDHVGQSQVRLAEMAHEQAQAEADHEFRMERLDRLSRWGERFAEPAGEAFGDWLRDQVGGTPDAGDAAAAAGDAPRGPGRVAKRVAKWLGTVTADELTKGPGAPMTADHWTMMERAAAMPDDGDVLAVFAALESSIGKHAVDMGGMQVWQHALLQRIGMERALAFRSLVERLRKG